MQILPGLGLVIYVTGGKNASTNVVRVTAIPPAYTDAFCPALSSDIDRG
jgi:hypothetical protein